MAVVEVKNSRQEAIEVGNEPRISLDGSELLSGNSLRANVSAQDEFATMVDDEEDCADGIDPGFGFSGWVW